MATGILACMAGNVTWVSLAERIGITIRDTVKDLESPRPDVAMARRQIRAMREALTEAEAELATREAASLGAQDIVTTIAQTYRALRRIDGASTRKAARLAMCLDACAHLAVGDVPAAAPDDEEVESMRLAVRVHGIGPTVLAMFAVAYPDIAVRLDRPSLDRLVMAWTAGVTGGRWKALSVVWRERVGERVEPGSIEREVKKIASERK